MIRVALTGGIATGKSYVLDRVRTAGVPCLDADDLAHQLTAAGTETTRAIAERFGGGMLTPDGGLDRRKMGRLAFTDPAARHELESIVHPAVYAAIAARLAGFERDGARCAVAAIPLLFETAREGEFRPIVATVCSPSVQIERLRARGLTPDEATQRLAAQLPAAEKAARADYVIRTDGTFADTDAQVADLVRVLQS